METPSMAAPAREKWIATSDPVISWPEEAGSLADMIPDLVRLNPQLDLRLVLDEDEDELLGYAGSALDVVTIAMPKPPTDQFMSELTLSNADWIPRDTEIGEVRIGPRRFERTATGDLLVRPKSWAAFEASTRFGLSYEGNATRTAQRMPVDQIGRLQRYWGIFREPPEVWEVEYAYMPANLFDRVGKRSDEDYWRTTPIGTISYIDQYDLPIEEHYRRAREIVKTGSEFAIVGNMQTGELRVFRVDGVQSSFEDIRMPEMPWFDVPAPRLQR